MEEKKIMQYDVDLVKVDIIGDAKDVASFALNMATLLSQAAFSFAREERMSESNRAWRAWEVFSRYFDKNQNDIPIIREANNKSKH